VQGFVDHCLSFCHLSFGHCIVYLYYLPFDLRLLIMITPLLSCKFSSYILMQYVICRMCLANKKLQIDVLLDFYTSFHRNFSILLPKVDRYMVNGLIKRLYRRLHLPFL
jgi:hypothetical protein